MRVLRRLPAAVFCLLLAAVPVLAQEPTEPVSGAVSEPVSEPGLAALAAPADVRVRARPLRGLKADIATLILSGQEGGALRTAILAAPVLEEDGRVSLPFWVEIEGSSLLGGERGEILTAEIYAYALTGKGSVKGYLTQGVRLELDELGEVLYAGGVKFAGHLELAPLVAEDQDLQLRVLVREPGSQRFGLRLLPLDLPRPPVEGEPAKPILLQPLFPETSPSWILAREHPHGEMPRGGAFAQAAFVPAVLPVLSAGGEIAAEVRLYDGGPAPRLLLRVLDAGLEPIQGGDLRIVPRPAADAGSRLQVFDARFALGELGSGNYVLELALENGGRQDGKQARRAPYLPVYVLAAEIAEDDVAWTELDQLDQRAERRQETLALEEIKRRKKRVARIAEVYRENVLAILAEGSRDEALAGLRALEEEVREGVEESPDALDFLTEAQRGVLAELAAAEIESLVPVLVLHMVLHDRYVAVRDFALARHSRALVLFLAETYARTSGSELAPVLAAEALSSLGAYLQQARLSAPGERMLEAALELDRDNTFALLSLAAGHERHGRYAEAIEYLRRLVEVEPRADEGRLRLALCLLRTGVRGEAGRLLRRVIDNGKDPWAIALAYQEMARLYLDEERFEEAVRLLEEATARLPGERRLYLNLAYALDRAGQKHRGSEVLASAPATAPASPRFVYNRHSEEGRNATRRELSRGSVVRLPSLSAALAASGGS